MNSKKGNVLLELNDTTLHLSMRRDKLENPEMTTLDHANVKVFQIDDVWYIQINQWEPWPVWL